LNLIELQEELIHVTHFQHWNGSAGFERAGETTFPRLAKPGAAARRSEARSTSE
jgi:hypothetical protein